MLTLKKTIRFSFVLTAAVMAASVAATSPAYAMGGGGFLGGLLGGLLGGGGGGGGGGWLGSIVGALLGWVPTATTCDAGPTDTIGGVLCNIYYASDELPGMITGIAYMMGMLFAVTALVKLKEHVESPNHHPLSDAVKRFVAGGAMFALPMVIEAARTTLVGGGLDTADQTGWSGSAAGGYGLDAMLVALVSDIYTPLHWLLWSFGYLAGMVFTVIGISRLLQTAQQGPRGPSGIGTIMTFIVAGVLFSMDEILGAFSSSMFADSNVATYAVLAGGGTGDTIVDDHILAVISSVLGFMTIVGWISFIRGFFILRSVAEGSGHASLMAAMTHIFGGALAVNLGPLMNAVQSTFGLTSFGIVFS